MKVTHRRLICLYNIRGSIGACAFVDETALKNHFATQPGLVIASKWVEIIEGENVFTNG